MKLFKEIDDEDKGTFVGICFLAGFIALLLLCLFIAFPVVMISIVAIIALMFFMGYGVMRLIFYLGEKKDSKSE